MTAIEARWDDTADPAESDSLAVDEPVPYWLTFAAWQVLAAGPPSRSRPALPANRPHRTATAVVETRSTS